MQGGASPHAGVAMYRAAALAISLAALSACANSGPDASPADPVIRELAPTQATPGQLVDVLGAGFCGAAGVSGEASNALCARAPEGRVAFGAGVEVTVAAAERWTTGRVTVRLPDNARAGAALVVVEVDGLVSAPAAFEVLP